MNIGKTGQPGHAFVKPGIMLHRTRAERIRSRVDRIVLLTEPHVMAHRLGLGKARQADLAMTLEPAKPSFEGAGIIDIDPGHIETPGLENQRLFDLQRAIAGESRVLPNRPFARRNRASLIMDHGLALPSTSLHAPLA